VGEHEMEVLNDFQQNQDKEKARETLVCSLKKENRDLKMMLDSPGKGDEIIAAFAYRLKKKLEEKNAEIMDLKMAMTKLDASKSFEIASLKARLCDKHVCCREQDVSQRNQSCKHGLSIASNDAKHKEVKREYRNFRKKCLNYNLAAQELTRQLHDIDSSFQYASNLLLPEEYATVAAEEDNPPLR